MNNFQILTQENENSFNLYLKGIAKFKPLKRQQEYDLIIKVKKGDWVTKNDIIGLIGSTGRSTGPHLHFTFMRHGESINPLVFIW